MTKIIVSIDNHTTTIDASMIPELNALIEREGVHFDESPFGNFQQLHPGEYWSDEIIKERPINNNFDIINYIKRQWEKWDNYSPEPEIKTAKERLADAKAWAEFTGLDIKFHYVKAFK
jgi:hypothetical protein